MAKQNRLGLYLSDADTKKRIKIAAAKRGVSATVYCAEAIVERLKRDGELPDDETRKRSILVATMDQLRQEIGSIGVPVSNLVKEGRRR